MFIRPAARKPGQGRQHERRGQSHGAEAPSHERAFADQHAWKANTDHAVRKATSCNSGPCLVEYDDERKRDDRPGGNEAPGQRSDQNPAPSALRVRSARRSARPAGASPRSRRSTGDGDPRNDRDEALERNLEAKAHGAAPRRSAIRPSTGEAQRMKVELVVIGCSSRPEAAQRRSAPRWRRPATAARSTRRRAGEERSQEAQGGELHPHRELPRQNALEAEVDHDVR